MIRTAVWLLRTFGSGPSIDTLIGDLMEEYREGRSALWFWAQAISGIATTFLAEVRGHKLLTIRAVATALTLMMILTLTVGYLRPWIVVAAEVYLPKQEPIWASTYSIVNGTKVALDQRVPLQWPTFIYTPVVRLALNMLGALVIGVFVRRTHKSIDTGGVLAAAVALILVAVVLRLYNQPSPPEGVPLLEPEWWMLWRTWTMEVAGTIVAFFVGGLTGGGRREQFVRAAN